MPGYSKQISRIFWGQINGARIYNIDSDEVLYYVDGDFMSRKNIMRGMIALHPVGIPHRPHPGTIEKSIGAKKTKELAVMVAIFHPLQLTTEALQI